MYTVYYVHAENTLVRFFGESDLSLAQKLSTTVITKLSHLDPSPALRTRRTTADYVAEALRAAILEGNFKDGEELNQVELAQHFGVSRVPVREALRQLQAEGLVDAQAHHRAVVIGYSWERLMEAFELRAVIEDFLLKKAAPKLDGSHLTQLRKLCAEMDLIEDRRGWLAKNREFHLKLYEPSDSKITLELDEQLMLRVERYMQGAGFVDPVEAGSDHREILDALEQGNTDQARDELRLHINRSCQRLSEQLY